MMDRERITEAANVVARRNSLSHGHGTREFKRMALEVVEQLQPDIDAEIEAKTGERLQAERERITTILDAPEAKGREDTARRLALSSDIRPEQAIEILGSTPKASQGPTPLDLAMQSETGTVGATDGGEDMTEEDHLAERILNAGE